MYRPNFCAECGERIVRVRWRVWTSRRFCAACDKRFRKGRIVLPLVAGVVLVGGGYFGGRASRPAPPLLVIERNASKPITSLSQTSLSDMETAAAKNSNTQVYGADGTAAERPTDPDEIVSICGARTKKGTPCSRRVRGAGRCWQHRGRPAMLPASKLIVQN